MKGFMQWFKSSNKMKRWMFLILIGILLACYGLAKILVMEDDEILNAGLCYNIQKKKSLLKK